MEDEIFNENEPEQEPEPEPSQETVDIYAPEPEYRK